MNNNPSPSIPGVDPLADDYEGELWVWTARCLRHRLADDLQLVLVDVLDLPVPDAVAVDDHAG